MTSRGLFRLYFNRHGADTQPWCISPDTGAWELCVRDVEMNLTSSRTVHRPKETPDEDDGKPSAWIEVSGELSVYADGTAKVFP